MPKGIKDSHGECREDGCDRSHYARGLCRPCYKRWLRASGRATDTRKTYTLTCETCGHTFTRRDHTTKYCSWPCRAEGNGWDTSKPIPWHQCRACGQWWIRKGTTSPYCSDACRPASTSLPPYDCQHCGVRCTPGVNVHHLGTTYCGEPCKKRAENIRQRPKRRIRNTYKKALERGSNGTFTLNEWGRRLIEYDGRCAYCQDPDATVEIEHVIPLGRGGTNRIANVVPACRACNEDKHTRTPQEWRESGRPRVTLVVNWPEGEAERVRSAPIAA